MASYVIFDMDGVIADTEPLHTASCRMLLEELNLNVDKILPKAYARSKREFWGEVVTQNKLPYSAGALTCREFELLIKIIKESNLQPTVGLRETLEKLYNEKYILAVASSSDSLYVQTVLDITGLKKYFSVVSCGNEVQLAKPAPDVYLHAMKQCDALAADTIAIEDSDTGIKAAKAAGLFCIGFDAVSDPKYQQKFDLADVVIHNICDVYDIVSPRKSNT